MEAVRSDVEAARADVEDERLFHSFPSRDPSPLLSIDAPRERILQSDVTYWMHEMSYSSLASTDSGYTQQPWLPDELSSHCMRCCRPFHLLRWTHHCRDCGGVFCSACSSHRVEADINPASQPIQAGPPVFRLCDECAFSPHRPHHLGCRNPLACPRCQIPRTLRQWLVYLQLATRMLVCCGICCCSDTCWCLGVGCVASLDASSPPFRRTAFRQHRSMMNHGLVGIDPTHIVNPMPAGPTGEPNVPERKGRGASSHSLVALAS